MVTAFNYCNGNYNKCIQYDLNGFFIFHIMVHDNNGFYIYVYDLIP
jgi:hypothetical protein